MLNKPRATTTARQEDGNPPALLQSAISARLRSTFGAEAERIVLADLENKRRNGKCAGIPLSEGEHAQVDAARRHVTERTGVPIGDLPLRVTKTDQSGTTATARPPTRELLLGRDFFSSTAYRAEALAVTAHEVSHAAGFVRYSLDRSFGISQTDSRTLANQTGWAIAAPVPGRLEVRLNMFTLFEEGAACAHEDALLVREGYQRARRTVQSEYRLDPSRPIDQLEIEATRKILGEDCLQGSHASAGESVTIARSFIRPFYEKRTDSGARMIESLYGPPLDALERLAPEIFPHLSETAARAALEDELVRGQATGHLKPLLTQIVKTLGAGAVRFLASIPLKDPNEPDQLSQPSRLLLLYADAAVLPETERRTVRTLLHRAVALLVELEHKMLFAGDYRKEILTSLRAGGEDGQNVLKLFYGDNRFTRKKSPVLEEPSILEEHLALQRVSRAETVDAAVEGIVKARNFGGIEWIHYVVNRLKISPAELRESGRADKVGGTLRSYLDPEAHDSWENECAKKLVDILGLNERDPHE